MPCALAWGRDPFASPRKSWLWGVLRLRPSMRLLSLPLGSVCPLSRTAASRMSATSSRSRSWRGRGDDGWTTRRHDRGTRRSFLLRGQARQGLSRHGIHRVDRPLPYNLTALLSPRCGVTPITGVALFAAWEWNRASSGKWRVQAQRRVVFPATTQCRRARRRRRDMSRERGHHSVFSPSHQRSR